MAKRDGRVVATQKLVDHGQNAQRFNIVILGDGYQAAELPAYAAAVEAFVARFQAAAPYTALWPAINIFRVDVASADSGVDDQGKGISRNTYFDSYFDPNLGRLLRCDTALAVATAIAQVPQKHMAFVIANTGEYGGSGGDAAVFSTNAFAAEIGLHEMGHTVFHLADEYPCYSCGAGETGHDRFSGAEPAQPNITSRLARPLKWETRLSAPGDALPTTANANCGQCDSQANPKPASYVGAYEGAGWFHCGCYRPSYDCRMRTIGQPFCTVCQGVITTMLQPFMPAVPSV
ncbi:MAG: M64 family metallopeptidase [Rhizomicrobium sp.]